MAPILGLYIYRSPDHGFPGLGFSYITRNSEAALCIHTRLFPDDIDLVIHNRYLRHTRRIKSVGCIFPEESVERFFATAKNQGAALFERSVPLKQNCFVFIKAIVERRPFECGAKCFIQRFVSKGNTYFQRIELKRVVVKGITALSFHFSKELLNRHTVKYGTHFGKGWLLRICCICLGNQ